MQQSSRKYLCLFSNFFNIIGVIKAAMAVTNRMFAILLPIMFPSAISGDPINTA